VTDLRIRTADNAERGRFEVSADEELAGYVTYSVRGAVLSLPHTEVEPRFRGRGLASALIGDVLDIARSRGLAVLPFCPFVSRYIAGHPDYLPLVPADQRARFGLDTAAHGRPSSAGTTGE